MLSLSTSFQFMRTSLHGPRVFPNSRHHGRVVHPLGFFLCLFSSFPHPENGVAATGESGGCSQHPRAGRGARRGPVPGKQGKGIRAQDPGVRPPLLPSPWAGPRAVLWVWGLGLGFMALASSVGRIPRAAERRRDNQPPRPAPAKPRGSSCALRQGKRPPRTLSLPRG